MTRVLCITVFGFAVLSVLMLAQDGPESAERGTKQFAKRVLVSGLSNPSEVIWGPDRMLWVAERDGKRVTRVDPDTGELRVAVTIGEVASPGGGDGLLGMALHPDLLRGTGNDYVYVAYTYVDRQRAPDMRVADPASPYRYLYGKIARFRYDATSATLTDPIDVITGLPAGNDHNAMRLQLAPDRTLHLSIGDMGSNQLGNFCNPVQAQRLPTGDEITRGDYAAYEGKTLRIALDGGVPGDNPPLAGVVSHVYTYGHRNPQGIAFGPDGTLYASDHGPKSDDEVNVLVKGGNYGWPHVAGMRDDKAYEYARWAEASTPCSALRFSDLAIDPTVPRQAESAYSVAFIEPIATLFTVPTGYNFEDPACKGVHFICWPTVAASSVEFYGAAPETRARERAPGTGIPGWDAVLLVTSLKRGSLYVVPLDATRKTRVGPVARYFQSHNRYRDVAVHPDGRTIYIATVSSGLVESRNGDSTSELEDRGAILAFTYLGEGDGRVPEPASVPGSAPRPVESGPSLVGPGIPPTFSAAQVTVGKGAYDGYCAVCHGSTLTNGTFGTPLAGEYFRTRWSGRSVAALYVKSRDTMPPSVPASLPRESYAAILAYILDVNGLSAGGIALPADVDSLRVMRIP